MEWLQASNVDPQEGSWRVGLNPCSDGMASSYESRAIDILAATCCLNPCSDGMASSGTIGRTKFDPSISS